jgi:hypothetical protein
MLAVESIMIAGIWKTLSKAGKPGWGAVVPGYNLYLFIRIARLSGIWLLYCLISFVNIVFILIVFMKVGERFSLNRGYAFGLLFLPFIFFPIIGFGKSVIKAEPS